MSRITKQISENLAVKLTEKQALKIKNLKANLEDIFTEMYLKTIPIEVIDFHSKFPKYTETRQNIQCTGNGFQWQYLNFNKSIPSISNAFAPNEKDARILLKLLNEIEDKNSELSKLKREIEVLVFGLRTYAKVNSEFPEAAPFLPNSVPSDLMVNISDLRKKLK